MSNEQPIEQGPVEMSTTIGKLAAALAKAQAAIHHAVKDATNPHFGSRFADLTSVIDACREPLASNGIAVLQPATADGKRVRVRTMLAHESGEWYAAALTLTAAADTPQAVGSCITYGRRYGLQSMVGVGSEDDDGEGAEGRGPQAQRARREPTPQARTPQRQPDAPRDAYGAAADALRKAATEDRIKKLLGAAREHETLAPRISELEAIAAGRLTEINAGRTQTGSQP